MNPANWGDNNSGTRTYAVLRDEIVIASGLPYGTTSYIDILGINGQTYTYKVRYVNGCDLATCTSGVIAADFGFGPSGLTNNAAADLSPCADSGVQITWVTDPVQWGDDGTGIRTYEVISNGILLGFTLPYGTTTYIDTSGTNSISYTYRIRYNNACFFAAATSPGAAAADNTDLIPCPDVGNTLLISKFDSNVILNWASVNCPDFSFYRVFGSNSYSASFPSDWTILANPLVTTYTEPLISDSIA